MTSKNNSASHDETVPSWDRQLRKWLWRVETVTQSPRFKISNKALCDISAPDVTYLLIILFIYYFTLQEGLYPVTTGLQQDNAQRRISHKVTQDTQTELTTQRYTNNRGHVRFEVFTAVTMKNGIFWVVTPCGSCKNRRFGGTWRLLHQVDKNR
jgi:hypothetical protein